MEAIIIYIISSVTISGIIVYVGKIIINKTFDLGVEKYKANLNLELEEYKSNLSKSFTEHQVKFTRLHEERGEKIKLLYTKIVELEKELIHLTSYYTSVNETHNILSEPSIKKLREMIDLVEIEKLYFSQTTINNFEKLIKESWDIIHNMRKVIHYENKIAELQKEGKSIPESYITQADLWDKANEKIQTEFQNLKNELITDFRILLGI